MNLLLNKNPFLKICCITNYQPGNDKLAFQASIKSRKFIDVVDYNTWYNSTLYGQEIIYCYLTPLYSFFCYQPLTTHLNNWCSSPSSFTITIPKDPPCLICSPVPMTTVNYFWAQAWPSRTRGSLPLWCEPRDHKYREFNSANFTFTHFAQNLIFLIATNFCGFFSFFSFFM